MSNLVRNERTKLVANALDRASTASLAVGVLGPLASAPFSLAYIATFLAWICGAVVLHFSARIVLGGLTP